MFSQNFIEESCILGLMWLVATLLTRIKSSPRPISTSQLNPLLDLHTWPINLVIYKGSYFLRMRDLILRLVSRLDAFSVYPSRT